MTEKEKMIAGKIYDPSDKELVALRIENMKKYSFWFVLKNGAPKDIITWYN